MAITGIVLQVCGVIYIGLDNKSLENVIIFLISNLLSIWFGCSKEPSHGDSSFENPKHTFWFRNKKIIF